MARRTPPTELPSVPALPAVHVPRRILHVEDDSFAAALVEATLGDAGFDVDWFSTAQAALDAAGAADYDIYLLDVGLPGSSGLLLAEELAGVDAGVPIIFVTGTPEDVPARRNLSVVPKPFAPSALVAAVQTAAAGRARAA
jgi:DNA-binding response OmpR family regulator